MPDKSGGAGKYATKEKSGSKDRKNYDPETTTTSGGGSPNIEGTYSPADGEGPNAPSEAKNNG